MDRHDASAGILALRQNVIEDGNLIFPGFSELGRTVETDFSYIPRLGQKCVEKTQFALALFGELRMQTERRPNAWRACGKSRRSFPCRRRCGHRQNVHAAAIAFVSYLMTVGIEIQVAVKIDHLTP